MSTIDTDPQLGREPLSFLDQQGKPCTQPLSSYLREQWRIFDYTIFSFELAKAQDEGRLRASKALVDIAVALKEEVEEAKTRHAVVEQHKDAAIQKYTSFRSLMFDNMITGLVNNFLCYLTDVLRLCILQRHELLRSSGNIRIDEVLSFVNMEEIVQFIADKKINELSYGGMNELNQFFSSRLNSDIWRNDIERDLLIVAIELRNIITHNRRRVNRIFLERTKGVNHEFECVLGERPAIGIYDVTKLGDNMAFIACRLDEELAVKFGLAREPFSMGVNTSPAEAPTATI